MRRNRKGMALLLAASLLLGGCGAQGGSSRSREILKNPVFMRVLRRGKTYENP